MSKDEGIYIRCTHTKGDDMLVYQSTDKAVGFIITSTELDENVAIMTDHTGVRKLRDYLNEILGEEQDTQPAAVSDLLAVIHRDGGHYQDQHGLDKAAREAEAIVQAERANQPAAGEPVAWECVHGCYVSLSYEKEGDPERAVPLFRGAPPAAAHGDDAVRKDAERYRALRDMTEGLDTTVDAMIAEAAAMRAQGDGGSGDA